MNIDDANDCVNINDNVNTKRNNFIEVKLNTQFYGNYYRK